MEMREIILYILEMAREAFSTISEAFDDYRQRVSDPTTDLEAAREHPFVTDSLLPVLWIASKSLEH